MGPTKVVGIMLLELQTLLHMKLNDTEISRRLSLSAVTVRYWRVKWGIQSFYTSKLSSKENDERLEAYHDSFSDVEAAAKLGIAFPAFNLWRRKRKLPRKLQMPGLKALMMRKKEEMNDLEIALQLKLIPKSWQIETAIDCLKAIHAKVLQGENADVDIGLYQRFLNESELTKIVEIAMEKVNVMIGRAMMKLCIVDEQCPYKPLLPGTDVSKVDLNEYSNSS